ncbi:xanthine dehydrogenase family protein molybdopterin-binding subunit [Alphaproteobacteria bacterium]|nr:xanthine dehydrogenase family protein molybdopterin-binding subunit [Alphaproteobacteria bacterium]
MKFGIGQAVKRVEDKVLLTGTGNFTDDVNVGEGLAIHFVRSVHAHAQINKIEFEQASMQPGVHLIATQSDLDEDNIGEIQCLTLVDNLDGRELIPVSRPPMSRGIARCAGDIIAMIVADTKEQAIDASELIEIDYQPLEAVVDVISAQSDDAPQLYPEYPKNRVFQWRTGNHEATIHQFEHARQAEDSIVELTVINNRIAPNALEMRQIVAMPDPESETEDGLLIWCGTQGTVSISRQIAKALNMPSDMIHVRSGNVGGGFGYKIFLHPEQLCASWAAKKLKKKLRWQQDRSEGFVSDLQGRDILSSAKALVSKTGKIKAVQFHNQANLGSWLSNFGIYVPTTSTSRTLTTLYDISYVSLEVTGVVTNTPAVDAYRGAGRPEANYTMERLMDKIAFDLNINRIEVRKINMIQPHQIPYETVCSGTIDSGDMPALFEAALKNADIDGFALRKKASEENGFIRGVGIALYLESCGNGKDGGVDIAFNNQGEVIIHAAQMENGQGHQTTLTQIFSDRLGYDAEKIKIIQGDSRRSPSGNTGGARMTVILGSATAQAAEKILQRAKPLAADLLNCNELEIEFEEGIFRHAQTNDTVTIEQLAKSLFRDDGPHPFDIKHVYTTDGPSFPYGCHIVEVEIDKTTLVPQIKKYSVTDDLGDVINPDTLAGQIHGGIAQGVGQAMYENVVYDKTGQCLTGSLMDYTLPRADHLTMVSHHLSNTKCQNNYLGVKGVGEAGTIGAPPAVVSAICDALSVAHIDMPITLSKLWKNTKKQTNI